MSDHGEADRKTEVRESVKLPCILRHNMQKGTSATASANVNRVLTFFISLMANTRMKPPKTTIGFLPLAANNRHWKNWPSDSLRKSSMQPCLQSTTFRL